MMHYYCIVALPPDTPADEVLERVDEVMAPHRETWDDDAEEHSGWWDWYQIGGRWTGEFDDYDPRSDPANLDGCGQVKWPTSWGLHAGDMALLGNVRERLVAKPPYRLVAPELMAVKEIYNPDGTHYDAEPRETAIFQQTPDVVPDALASLSDRCVVVIVDYHN